MGTNVVTVGTRHVKVWRFEVPSSPVKPRRGLDTINDTSNASPVPKTFAGRNVLLGLLKDAVFTCVIGIAEDMAVLCTQNGAICLLDDAARSQRLFQVSKKDYCISCVTLDRSSGVIWVGGKEEEPQALPLDFFYAARDSTAALEPYNNPHMQAEPKGKEGRGILAICAVDGRLVTIDTSRSMSIYDIVSVPTEAPKISATQQLPAHDSAIISVVVLPQSDEQISDFLTYSEEGNILYWSWNGNCTGSCFVPLDQPLAPDAEDRNELRVVRHLSNNNTLLTGDKAGVLRLLDRNGYVAAVTRAHDGEMHDLTVDDLDGNGSLAASCGRDRIIQLFRVSKNECLLEQSLINEHAGPLRKVEFAEGGSTLASMSSDRTVILHKKVVRTDDSIAFVSTKTINLKASPTSMCLLPDLTPGLIVSATDRCVRKINVTEGKIIHTFKTSDALNGEFVALNRLAVGVLDQKSNGVNVLAGFSLADGLIRVYDTDTGSLLAVVQGQNAVSDLALVQTSDNDGNMVTRLVSTGVDGTIFLWKLTTSPDDGSGNTDPSKPKTPSSLRLVRRVLSKAEIAGFQRSLKEKDGDNTILPRNFSPSRLRRKPSRYATCDLARAPEPHHSTEKSSPDSPAHDSTHRHRITHASPPLSPKVSLQSRTRRSSLDERHRHAATSSAHSVSSTAKQISSALQDFRKLVANSKESLSSHSAQALQRELRMTLDIFTQRLGAGERKSDERSSESFDDYLAKMIDEDLRSDPGRKIRPMRSRGQKTGVPYPQKEVQTTLHNNRSEKERVESRARLSRSPNGERVGASVERLLAKPTTSRRCKDMSISLI
ncbi:MAG: hypothetical protein Q9166_001363 [cf. Caloplaca sp. 2 TL-2023]